MKGSDPGAGPDPASGATGRFALPLQVVFAAVVLSVYVSTLYPSVPGGDAGELIVAAHELGVAHPPGYPLFTLLAHAFTWIPAGTVAWRVNLLTAVLGALAATVLLRATFRLTGSAAAGLLAGGLFAFSPLVWRYAIQAEVFSLNNLFAAILLLLLVEFERRRERSTFAWFCFWFGLGLTNHHTLLLLGAPIALWMLYRAPARSVGWRGAVRLAACAGLGLSPHSYLLVAPADLPSTTWGGTSTLSGFVEHLLRRQYGTLQLGTMEAGGSLAARLAAWFAQLPGELLWIGAPLALFGLAPLAARRDAGARVQATVVAVFLGALALYLVVFHALSGILLDDPFWYEVHSRFWQQANLVVCLFAGVGFAWLASHGGRTGRALAPVAALLLVGAQAVAHHTGQDQSGNRSIARLAEAQLGPLPHGALLITKGDLHWNTLRYEQICEGLRPDVRILDVELLKAPWMTARVERAYPDLDLPAAVYRAPSRRVAGSYDLGALFDAVVGRFPVLTNALDHGDASWQARYTSWPEGLLDRVHPKDAAIDVEAWLARTDRWAEEAGVRFADGLLAGSWEQVARAEYGRIESRRGARLLTAAVAGGLDDVALRRTVEILEGAAAGAGEPQPAVYLNLGIVHYLLRGREPGAVSKMIGAWRTWQRIAPPDDPQRALVERVLRDPERAEIGIGAR